MILANVSRKRMQDFSEMGSNAVNSSVQETIGCVACIYTVGCGLLQCVCTKQTHVDTHYLNLLSRYAAKTKVFVISSVLVMVVAKMRGEVMISVLLIDCVAFRTVLCVPKRMRCSFFC